MALKTLMADSSGNILLAMSHKIYFLYALCPLPFAYFLFVHFNRHIRADAAAEGAGRAFASVLEDNKMIPFLVELVR